MPKCLWKIYIPELWLERVRQSTDLKALRCELNGIERTLEVHKTVPYYRAEFEILQLKKQKIFLQCKIRLLEKE